MNLPKVLSILFILALLILVVIPIVSPVVKAAGPTVTLVQSAQNYCTVPTATCTVTFASNPVAGNLIAVTIGWGNNANPTLTSVASTADSFTTNTIIALTCCAGPFYDYAVSGYVLSTLGGANAKAITVTLGGSATGQFFVNAFEVSVSGGNSWQAPQLWNQGSNPAVNGFSMGSSTAFTSSLASFAVAGVYPYCPGDSSHVLIPGTGYTFVAAGAPNYIGAEYEVANAPLSTTFLYSMNNNANPCNAFDTGQLFTYAAIVSTQTQTVGSCPKAGNGHVVPANSTQYWYSGNALGQEVASSVQTEVSSVKGSTAQNIQLALYLSTAQTPSAQYPATLAWYQIVSVSAGTVNSTITFQVNIPLNSIATTPLPFNFWAVAIVGNDHVYIVQSTLSGMTTQSGNAAGSVQPYSFTSAGSSSALKMGLCATGSYQSVLPAVTTTVTTGGTTSTTVSTTTTATISTIGPALFSTASNWPVIFLILLLPSGLFLGVTRSLAGALLGLSVGSVIGLMMGILPPFVFAGILIALVAVAFVSKERSP